MPKPRTFVQNVYRANRSKVFENDDVRLWLVPQGTQAGAVIELEQRRTKSQWTVVWRGSVSAKGNVAVVQTQ